MIFGFLHLANSVFALKNSVFLVLVSCVVCRFFINLVFGFQFLSTMMLVFQIFLPIAFYSFYSFAKEVTPSSCIKTLFPRDH